MLSLFDDIRKGHALHAADAEFTPSGGAPVSAGRVLFAPFLQSRPVDDGLHVGRRYSAWPRLYSQAGFPAAFLAAATPGAAGTLALSIDGDEVYRSGVVVIETASPDREPPGVEFASVGPVSVASYVCGGRVPAGWPVGA